MTSNSDIPTNAPKPRLCHTVKWTDFDGYGFNLHADKSRPGQYIGKVDDNSPASVAGLLEGDRIIEVNGVNISNENHKQVVQRIKNIPNETKLLVVDSETDKWYKEHNIVVFGDQTNIIHGTSIRSPSEDNVNNADKSEVNGHANGGYTITEEDGNSNAKSEEDEHSVASVQSSSHSESSTQPQQSSSPNGSEATTIEQNSEIPENILTSPDYDNVVLYKEEAEKNMTAQESSENSTTDNHLQDTEKMSDVDDHLQNTDKISEVDNNLQETEKNSDVDNHLHDTEKITDEDKLQDTDKITDEVKLQDTDKITDEDKLQDTEKISNVDNHLQDEVVDVDNAKTSDHIDDVSNLVADQDSNHEDKISSLDEDKKSDKDDEEKVNESYVHEELKDDNPVEDISSHDQNNVDNHVDDQVANHRDDGISGNKNIEIEDDPPNYEEKSSTSIIESPMSTTPTPPPSIEPEVNGTATETTQKTQITHKYTYQNSGLNLNMTAAEMRAHLASKKKVDPRTQSLDLKQKYQIIQNM